MKTYQNFIGGEWVTSTSNKRVPNINPTNADEVLGETPLSTRAEAVAATDIAAEAFHSWRKTPAPKRGAIVSRAAQIMTERKEQIARALSREEGKLLAEARGELQRTINIMEFCGSHGRRLTGETIPLELADNFGYTHETMAEKLGKSRTSITEILTLTAMPEMIREHCRRADIHSKSLLLQIVRQSTPEKMQQLIARLATEGGTRDQARRIAKETKPKGGRGRARPYVFRYQPREKTFSLHLKFRKSDVDRTEVIAALESIIAELRKER